MSPRKVESADGVMNSINTWVAAVSTLHDELKPFHWEIPPTVSRSIESVTRSIHRCFHEQNMWAHNIPPNLDQELCWDDWGPIVDHIRDGIFDGLTTILSQYQTGASKLPVMIDHYNLPNDAMKIAKAILMIMEYAQRMRTLLSYLSNKSSFKVTSQVIDEGRSIQKKLRELEDNRIHYRGLSSGVDAGCEADISLLACIAKESSSLWTEDDIRDYLSSDESYVQMMKYKSDIIGFALFRLLDDHMSIEEPIFDIGFDTMELKVDILKPLRRFINDSREEVRFAAHVGDESLLELLQHCGFVSDESEEGLGCVTHVMTKGPPPPAMLMHDIPMRDAAAGIVHIVNHGDWNIVEPEGFQS